MRTLIISDVHANLTALDAVLSDAEPFDNVWCLGDVVGYGPDPDECITRIRSLPGLKCIRGNHDAALLGDINVNAFNNEARASLEWQDEKVEPESKRWLESLPSRMVFNGFTLAHGSPKNPVWEYVVDQGVARANMTAFDTPVCLVGHTHIPCIYQMAGDTPESTQLVLKEPGETFSLEGKSIVNPGSVGQPRDYDPRSSYLIHDDQEGNWTYYRVAYDVKKVQKRITAAGLPERHASRLKGGW